MKGKKTIDQWFAELLRPHRETPSPKAWERLERALDAQQARRRRRWWPLLLLLAFAAAGGAYFYPWEKTAGKPQPGPEARAEFLQEAPPTAQTPPALPPSSAEDMTETLPGVETPGEASPDRKAEGRPARAVEAGRGEIGKAAGTAATTAAGAQAGKAFAEVPANQPDALPARALPIRVAEAMPLPLPLLSASAKPARRYRVRVEVTVPYRPVGQSPTEPERRMNWRRVLEHVLDD